MIIYVTHSHPLPTGSGPVRPCGGGRVKPMKGEVKLCERNGTKFNFIIESGKIMQYSRTLSILMYSYVGDNGVRKVSVP